MQRYFVDQPLTVGQIYTELDIDTHHILNVMRMSIHDKIEIVDKNQHVFLCEIINSSPFTIKTIEKRNSYSRNIIVDVYTPLLKGDKLDFMLQKATELGASHFKFYEAERAIVKLDDKKRAKRLTRFEKIVAKASEQSKRVDIPTIDFNKKLKSIDFSSYDHVFLAYEALKNDKERRFVDALHKNDSKIAIIFGPEGGFTENEVTANEEFTVVQLGKRILRAETAPLYMLSIIDSVYN